MNIHDMLICQLDDQLKYWQEANSKAPRPNRGWVRTIRKALGITIKQLANRLDLDPSRIIKIETSELTDHITLKTLRDTAEALECEFVYALIPKVSLRSILLEKASEVAQKQIDQVSHSMALENQSVSKTYQDEQMKELHKALLSKPRMLSSLWNKPKSSILKNKIKTGRKKPRGRPSQS